jgi:hypothetical protein
MSSLDARATRALNEVIVCFERAEAGYRTAAADETNTELQNLLTQYSDQRSIFLAELRSEIKKISGGDVETGEGDDRPSGLTGVEYDDSDTLNAVESALEEDIPDGLREVLERQYEAVAEAHDHLLELRDLVADASKDIATDR